MDSRTGIIQRMALSYVFLLIFLPLFIFLDEGAWIFCSASFPGGLRNPSRPSNGKPNFGDHAMPPIALCGAVSMLLLENKTLNSLYPAWKITFTVGLLVVLPLMIYYDYKTLRGVAPRSA